MVCDLRRDCCDMGTSGVAYHLLSHATGTVEVVHVTRVVIQLLPVETLTSGIEFFDQRKSSLIMSTLV